MGLLIIGSVAYFLPTIIAAIKQKRNTAAVAALNLLLGWSIIGWIVSLIWSLSVDTPTLTITNITNVPMPAAPLPSVIQIPNMPLIAEASVCSGCGAKLLPRANFCTSCGRSA